MKLKYPPIKQQTITSIPDKLIYYRFFGNRIHDFSISTTAKPYTTGVLSFYEGTEYLHNGTQRALYISLIKTNPQRQGLGTELLNMAINFSKKMGLEGRIYLNAVPTITPNQVPHIFYRKFGMNTEDEKLNKKMDRFIKAKQNATIKDFPTRNIMYYPPVPTVKPQNFIDKVMTYFKELKTLKDLS